MNNLCVRTASRLFWGALKISRVPSRGEATRAAGMRRHGRRIARKNRIRRTTTSTIRGVPQRGDDRVDAGERSSPRRPLRKNWANWREDQTAATPRTRFPRKRSPGAEDPRTRTEPPHGPSKTRAEPVDKVQRPGREIPDRALRKRANTDVASRARLPGFSPRVDRKMRRGVGRRTGVREKRELTFAM